jgi:hypothetical protein
MKNITYKILILTVIFLNSLLSTQAQQDEWVRVYGDDIHNSVNSLIETYDGGYIMGGHIKTSDGNSIKNGFILKTDINGEILWQKIIADLDGHKTGGVQISQTSDGGYVLLSNTLKYQGVSNVMIMKLNKCGEKEWNKIFIDNNMHQFNYGIQIMNDGTYLIQLSYWHSDLGNDRIWLFNIDQQGEIIWQKAQANWTLGTNAEEGYHLLKNSNNEYLISGNYYQCNPGEDTNMRYKRPLFIKVDSLGNEIWHQLWGINDFFYGSAYKSAFDTKGNIYGVGRNESYNELATGPVLFKLCNAGEQLYHKDLIEDADGGNTTTINIMDDTTLFIGANWYDSEHNDHNRILKTDTLGNIIDQRELLNEPNTFSQSLITFDNKLLVSGSFYIDNSLDIYLWKLNKDLEYDSIYTQPRVYDSLCPYPIVSDTLDIDTTIVNLQEIYAQLYKIKVHPNPVSSKLHITLGDLTKGTDFILYNTNGQAVKQIQLQGIKREYELNISDLPAALYVLAFLDNGKIVDREKVVIQY